MNKVISTIRRVDTLDLLRGYFLIVIILNHLWYYPSGLEFITGKSQLYASTAEGFFLISGIVLGIVRGAKLIDRPMKEASKLLFKRAWQLYLASFIMIIVFTLIGWALQTIPGITGIKSGLTYAPHQFWEMLWNTIILQYTYGWADYLRLYAIFIAFAPLALWLLRKGLWYVVIAASIGVWMLYPFSPWPAGWLSAQLSWQLVFFVGFVVGFYWGNIQEWWKKLNKTFKKYLTGVVVVTGLASIVAVALIVTGHGLPVIGDSLLQAHRLIESNFEKHRLPVPRLALFSLWFLTFYWIFHRFEKQIKKWFGWILLPFGANSLYVYIMHAIVLYFFTLLTNRSEHWWLNLIMSLSVIAIVYLALKKKFLIKIIPR